MQKLCFFFLLLLFPSILFAQKRSQIVLQSSSVLESNTKTNITKVKNPVFSHDNAILTCDSANYNKELNYFEAFNNVHINQGDTVNIYSTFLTYDGNTKQAHLTDKVRMIDRTSTLTTNVLDYNLGTKIGTYVDGGKIVNKDKDVTITSRNGWYFANTKDAYFRYNVLVVTPQSTIKSDTLQYNTLTNLATFHGPTNIKGKDDNLYTENGTYNTKTEIAKFGKKNLYTQASKSLKGDSLFYDGKAGYGKAVRNIVFKDTSDNTLLRGQLGEYFKADERVVVTKNAYFAMGTKDSITVGQKKMPDSIWLGADILETKKELVKNLKILNKPIIQKDNEVGADDEKAKAEKAKEKAEARKQAAAELNAPKPAEKPAEKKLSRKERKLAEEKAKELKDHPPIKPVVAPVNIDSIKSDSVKNAMTIKLKAKIDTVKPEQTATVKPKSGTVPTTTAKPVVGTVPMPKKDSVVAFNPADTVRTRIIKAYHNVRVFKSNMQAIADSLFYTAADSALRWYNKPMLWSNGTQQTGDTIYVFFKNDKINSFQVFQNSFTVNVETDSTKFNQVKGKRTTGFFDSEGDLKNMYVDGNAESIYFSKNDKTNEYDKMSQSISGRIKFTFSNKELSDIMYIRDDEGVTHPIDKLPKETILTGFIWKPELRPLSKEDIIKGRPVVKPTKAPTKTSSKADDKKPMPAKPISPTSKKGAIQNLPAKTNLSSSKDSLIAPLKTDTTGKPIIK